MNFGFTDPLKWKIFMYLNVKLRKNALHFVVILPTIIYVFILQIEEFHSAYISSCQGCGFHWCE